jgi:hypothetical protein
LRNVNELLLRLPVKQGFVEKSEIRVSYATRLHKVLTLLFGLSQDSAERSLLPAKNFVDTLHNIYHFNYGVSENLQQSQLILSATFDSSWESYFHNLVDKIGAFLDTVFCHCQGFEGRSCADGYEAFADFIREHQVQTGMLYSATPELTTDDLRTLKRTRFGDQVFEPGVSEETAQKLLAQDQIAWGNRYRSPEWQDKDEYKRLRLLSLERFFRSVWELRKLFPTSERVDGWRSAQDVYDEAASQLAFALKENAVSEDKGYLIEAARNALLISEPDRKERIDAICWFVTLGVLTTDQARPLLEDQRLTPAEAKQRAEAAVRPCRPVRPVQPELPTDSVQVDILDETGSKEAVLVLAQLPTRNRKTFLVHLKAALDGGNPPVNVAFTYDGLRRLGLEPETLELFPKEFQEGMARRGAVYLDCGWPNHSDYWCLRGERGAAALNSVDLVIVFHNASKHDAESFREEVGAALNNWYGRERESCVIHMEFLGGEEPFAFKEPAKNQPEVDAYQLPKLCSHEPPDLCPAHKQKPYTNQIARGDVVLGHADHRGFVAGFASATQNPATSRLFHNGTFLVLRKLAQNPEAYFSYVQSFNETQHQTLGSERAKDDTYDNVSDTAYPRISHLRRSNSRRPGGPRIVRRSFRYSGAPYANDNGSEHGERGHMFMCYNASIAEQYEVIQRWINGGNSTALLSSKIDLVAGQQVPHRLAEHPSSVPHVTVRWGLYAFVPSKVALGLLANAISDQVHGALSPWEEWRDADERARVCRGLKLLSKLEAIKDHEVARLSWKELFETHKNARDARAVWAAIRSQGGHKATPYGFLVADAKTAEVVLSDDSRFSVAEYKKRFLETGFDFYLGSDRAHCPHMAAAARSYETMAKANNYARDVLAPETLLRDASNSAMAFLDAAQAHGQTTGTSMRFDVRDFARWIVGDICRQHIGIPSKVFSSLDGRATLGNFLDHFLHVTHYSSFPHPEQWVAQRAIAAGEALRKAYDDEPLDEIGLGPKLVAKGYDAIDPTAVRDAIIIANIGFVPPAVSMLTLMLTKWLDNGDMEQPQLRERDDAYSAVVAELRYDSTFTTMYRTAREGNGLTTAGSFVVVGMQSAMADDIANGVPKPERWMFGGEYEETAHGCPLRQGALRVLAGAVSALARYVHKETSAGRHLIASGPFVYRFEDVRRVVPGKDRPSMPVAQRIGAIRGAVPSPTSGGTKQLNLASSNTLIAAAFLGYPGKLLDYGLEGITISANATRELATWLANINRLRILGYIERRYPDLAKQLDGGAKRILRAFLDPESISNAISLLSGDFGTFDDSELGLIRAPAALMRLIMDTLGTEASFDNSFVARQEGADKGPERWFFINGIVTSRDLAQRNLDALQQIFRQPFTLIHNPTQGLTHDLLESTMQKFTNVNTEPVVRTYLELARALVDNTSEKVVVVAHSQGTIVLGDALDLLYVSIDRKYFDRTNLTDEDVRTLMETSSATVKSAELRQARDALNQAGESVLRKLELYMFANAASRVCYSDLRGAPHIESFANEHDIVTRLGSLASDDFHTEDLIRIDGSLFTCDRYGHLLNAHYLPDFVAGKYKLREPFDGRCIGSSVHDRVNGNPCFKHPQYTPGPRESRLLAYARKVKRLGTSNATSEQAQSEFPHKKRFAGGG